MAGAQLPLAGVRVIDIATLIAGPTCARLLGDFGADVIKVERPDGGDPVRTFEYQKNGVSLWWKCVSRNKRPITLNLKHPEGKEILLRLVETADAIVENFRPGTLYDLGVGPDAMLERNPRLIVTRISGFGAGGPYSDRPGFGTLAEAISGYADLTGFADRPPLLPATPLADELSGMQAAYATMVALYHRDLHGGPGQVIDIALYESLFGILGPLPTHWQQNHEMQKRRGSRLPFSAPRNAFATADGHNVAVSGSSPAAADRICAAIERPDLVDDPRFKDNLARVANSDELDEIIADWIGRHDLRTVLARFEECGAAAAPIYDMEGIFADPHYSARGSIAFVPDAELGEVAMQNIGARLSETPGEVRHAGLSMGAATTDVLGELGYGPDEIDALRENGVV